IFANAFAGSQAYFNAEPLSVCLTGAREWSPMYPLVHSVRLVEALEEYRKNGLNYKQYWLCRNFALNNFASDMAAMIIYRKRSGVAYINPIKIFFKNILYPNTYLSLFYFLLRRMG
ncbi:MAG: glycosyltransferase family 2 protein, partial [Cytophagales bacterium]|nr:glycosyltransferase family 2 protein [Cytophaga sp.]